MRFAIVAAIAAMLVPQGASATCKFGPVQLKGTLKRNVERSFTLTRGSTMVRLNAVGWDKKLSFKVLRPDGSEICAKGPENTLTCAFEVSDRATGSYPVRISNATGQKIDYWLTCNDE